MKNRSKFSHQQRGEQQAAHEIRSQNREFATAEELLRFDAGRTEVPPEVAERLKESIRPLVPPPRRSWWRNLFGQ
jgi:hypothetical protein